MSETSNCLHEMRYLYGEADEKFVKAESREPRASQLSSFKFRLNSITQYKENKKEFDKTDMPLVFKTSPDNLLNLCLQILDAIALPAVYSWTIDDICKWLREIGYKQYQNTFRENLINGRKLILVNASALVAMNIRDFNHIKDITRGIRGLFHYEMTKFGRSLTLYPELYNSLYKLFRVQTGGKFDIRRSDLWRRMQMIQQNDSNYSHWEILERWLAFDRQSQKKVLLGGAPRANLYACRTQPPKLYTNAKSSDHCACLPPCECFFTELDRRPPWRLKSLPQLTTHTQFVKVCNCIAAPCTCRRSPKKYTTLRVLTRLKKTCTCRRSPKKYTTLRVLTRLKKTLPHKYNIRKYEKLSSFTTPEQSIFSSLI